MTTRKALVTINPKVKAKARRSAVESEFGRLPSPPSPAAKRLADRLAQTWAAKVSRAGPGATGEAVAKAGGAS